MKGTVMVAPTDTTNPTDRPNVYTEDGMAIYRASGVSRCLRALVAIRQGYDQMSPPEDMQRRFDDGHLHEPAILAEVEKRGWSLHGQQDRVELAVGASVVIRGHVDAFGVHPVHGFGVIDAKALSDSGFKKWVDQGWKAFPYYADQLTIYATAVEADCIVMAVKNKNSGEVHLSVHAARPADIKAIKARVLKAEALSKKDGLPPCDKKDYPCPVYYLHEEEAPVVAAEQSSNGLLAEATDAYWAAKAREDKAKADKDDARATILELIGSDEKTVVGNFTITQTVQRRKNLDRKAITAAGIDLSPYESVSQSTVLKVVEAQ